MLIKIPVSVGELFDKISILQVKKLYIKDKKKLDNIEKEYKSLSKIASKIDSDFHKKRWYKRLVSINENLWHIENGKRSHEKAQKFDEKFITLSRDVYLYNDERARVKANINKRFNSEIVEEKSHPKY